MGLGLIKKEGLGERESFEIRVTQGQPPGVNIQDV